MKRDVLVVAMSTPDLRVTFDVGDSMFTLTLTEREFERLRNLILALYSPDGVTGFDTWDWRTA